MKHNYSAKYANVLLRPLCAEDIENLRTWRNNTEQTRFLRSIGYITPQMQQTWFENYLEDPDIVIFAIVENSMLNRMVGSVALYSFKGDEAEVGKIQIGDPEAAGRGLGKISLVLAMWIGFKKMGLKKIVGAVHQVNIAAHKTDMKIGFQIVGNHPAEVGGLEDDIEIDEARLCEMNSYTSEIKLDVM